MFHGPDSFDDVGQIESPLRDFIELAQLVASIEEVVESESSWPQITRAVATELQRFLVNPHALEEPFLRGIEDRYARYLVHGDPAGRFVVLALVWGPGHQTPIHDHKAWGVMAVYRGAIREVRFALDNGLPMLAHPRLHQVEEQEIARGEVSFVIPPERDLHRMRNHTRERTVTVHVYGCEMLECNVYCDGQIQRRCFEYDQPGQ